MTLPADRRWYFREKHPGEPRHGDIPTQHALEEDIKTFVRETLQNANDAGIEGGRPVEVIFRFLRLTGDELDSFKEALQWDELKDHLDGAKGGDHSLRLEQFLEHIEEKDELLILLVEDRHTKGLTGTETEDKSNYTALVRDMQISHKDESAGGSHGVGKTVLWAFSGISTVLFTSIPSSTDGQEPPRFIGRTVLPDHRENGTLYEGLGWFGVDGSPSAELERPASAWNGEAEALTEALQIDSYDNSTTGTSAAVLGFSSPLGEIAPDIEEVAADFERAAVKYFWPAIEYGHLSVKIQTPDDEEPQAVSPANVPEIQPFRTAFNQHFADTNTELAAPGDVVEHGIEFDPANKRDGTSTEAGEVNLVARLPMPSDSDELVNNVAMFRGAGMVVDYRDMSGAVSGNDFHAILAAGQARSWGTSETTEADKDIEEFLRTAEPAAHQDWQSTPKLTKQYKQGRGYRNRVKQLKRQKLRDALSQLVSSEDDSAGEFIKSISQHLPIGESGGSGDDGPPPSPDVFDWEPTVWYDGAKWQFEGDIEPVVDEYESWTATVSLTRLGEDNSKADTISVGSLSSSESAVDCEVVEGSNGAVGEMSCDENVGRIEFEGGSEEIGTADPSTGLVGKLRLEITGEVVETGGDD